MYNPIAEIHLDRLVRNLQKIQAHVDEAKVMPVVKANAYGHGAIEVAKRLQKENVVYLGVFTLAEALELRRSGIEKPIMIFCRITEDMLAPALEQNFTLNFSSKEDFKLVTQFISKTGKGPKFHLKVDTGMSRLGIPFEEVERVLKKLISVPLVELEGIYSHFATSDEGDPAYAQLQISRFNKVIELCQKLHFEVKYFHIANSGGVLNLPTSFFNLVRVGMLMYGAYPSDETTECIEVEPVMNFKGPIVAVRRVTAGTPISYGSVYAPDSDANIAVIQTGFADGFPRNWYKHGYVGYRGKNYPIAGRVCMDQFMVNFGDEYPEKGEEVLLFGDDRTNRIRIEDIAVDIDSTSYVLMTAIGGRTERVYV